MSSATCFNLDQCKILSSGNGYCYVTYMVDTAEMILQMMEFLIEVYYAKPGREQKVIGHKQPRF